MALALLQERGSPEGYAEPESQQGLPQTRQLTADEVAQGCKLDPCIGMRVKRFWPDVSTQTLTC